MHRTVAYRMDFGKLSIQISVCVSHSELILSSLWIYRGHHTKITIDRTHSSHDIQQESKAIEDDISQDGPDAELSPDGNLGGPLVT